MAPFGLERGGCGKMKSSKKRKLSGAEPVIYGILGIVVILFFLFNTLPFLQGIFYSFTDWKGYGEWEFVGLKNYKNLLIDKSIINSYSFTLKFALICTILVNVISLILACALNTKIKWKNAIKAVYFLPYMLGSLMVGFIFNFIFSTLLPQFGKSFGIEWLSKNILGTDQAIWGIIIVTVWSSVAFNTLIYIAGLQSIETQIYEAAAIDGAVGFTRFRTITFPLLASSFTVNMVLSAKGYLMVYDQIMAMTNGGPGELTTSISVLIYKKGFSQGQFALQSANAVVLFLMIAVISFIQMRILEKREEKLG